MNYKIISMTWLPVLASVLAAGSCPAQSAVKPEGPSPAKVEVRCVDGRWRLYVNQQPFYIKGAGIELGPVEKLKEHGGNSFRTWSTDNGRDSGETVLNRALTNGLFVAMGLDVDHERRGFDYDNTNAIARQFAALTAQVKQYKDHPALLIWVIGNELNMERNPKVWDAVNDLSKAIHQIDPNHPTTTALAGFDPATVNLVKTRAPDLDFLSFQMYYDIINLPKYLKQAGWNRPYLVTEFGATGHWECPKTDWGAPIEDNSTVKAGLYEKRFERVIQSDPTFCLGSYVFLWGNKQERTPTWYGMFLKTGEETAAVDTMQYLWTGAWPGDRSPVLDGMWLDGKTAYQNIRLKPGQTYASRVQVSDSKNSVTYSWEVMKESKERKVGGDVESIPEKVPDGIADPQKSEITLTAPTDPGAYRLYAYAFDGKGHAAYANIPFYVTNADDTASAAAESETGSN